ncbi:MAG: ABC transporter permease, partial [Clostridiales bacterium]|nr:ABC transporter permease [Clostridiales bacterium]
MKQRKIDKGIFALPYAVVCVLFVVFPLLLVLVYAFRDSDGGFTVRHFVWVFSNASNWLSILRTVGISLVATGICLLIAYPVAYILASAPFNKIAILALLFVVPMWMNFMLRMFALQSILSMLGIANSFWAAIIGLVYDFFPFMLLPIYTALCNL